MKPRLIDRLVMICLAVNLALAFWYLSCFYTFQHTLSSALS